VSSHPMSFPEASDVAEASAQGGRVGVGEGTNLQSKKGEIWGSRFVFLRKPFRAMQNLA